MRAAFLLGSLLASVGACAVALGEHTAEIHDDHAHVHGDNCGHTKVWHTDHWDYLHDGHLHAMHDGHVDEHTLDVTSANPAGEAPMDPAAHAGPVHDGTDTHTMIRHGDHIDYIHDGHLHYVHGDHVDDHGPVTVEENG